MARANPRNGEENTAAKHAKQMEEAWAGFCGPRLCWGSSWTLPDTSSCSIISIIYIFTALNFISASTPSFAQLGVQRSRHPHGRSHTAGLSRSSKIAEVLITSWWTKQHAWPSVGCAGGRWSAVDIGVPICVSHAQTHCVTCFRVGCFMGRDQLPSLDMLKWVPWPARRGFSSPGWDFKQPK